MTRGLFILPVGGSLREYEEHAQSIVVSVLKPGAMRRWSSMSPSIATVPPLLAPAASKEARKAVRQRLSVHPSRAISGIEQPGKLPMILIASSRRTPS
jgi:hypothetical protein